METILDLLVVIRPLIFVVGLIMMFKQIELEIKNEEKFFKGVLVLGIAIMTIFFSTMF